MVRFELGKEIEKDVFHLVMSMEQRKILCPQEDLNPTPLHSALRCSITKQQELYGEQCHRKVSCMHKLLLGSAILIVSCL